MIRLKVEDYDPHKKRWWLRLREKNCKVNEMPCHYKLETYLDEYSQAAGIVEDRKEPLSAPLWDGRGRFPIAYCLRTDVWCIVRRRAADAQMKLPLAVTPSAQPASPII